MLRRKLSNASEKEPQQVQKKKLTLQRSSSFKDFMKHKPTSPVVADKEFTLNDSVQDQCGPVEESGKSGGKLGKKWRAVITRTMTRKTSKMVQKALAEEDGESGEDGSMSPMSADWAPDLRSIQRTSVCSTESEENMHSPVSRQLSGCGDRQSLDSGFSQRDSMRLEDSVPYNGPFCGRALVHTDFTPSPYDIESLKLQKGDIIDIIEKPPVGTWTGKLSNKVGSFKFIYVTVLPNEDTPSHKERGKGRKRRSKPKSLEEVLGGISLMELSPLLSMHGFESLEDFRGLTESHLNELNIIDPQQRTKLLTAAELLHDSDGESDEEESCQKSTEPRDSGCFESTENLDNGQEEETETHSMSEQQNPEPKSELISGVDQHPVEENSQPEPTQDSEHVENAQGQLESDPNSELQQHVEPIQEPNPEPEKEHTPQLHHNSVTEQPQELEAFEKQMQSLTVEDES